MTHRHRVNLAIAAALLASVAVVGCKRNEEPVATTPAPVETAPAPAPAAPAPAAPQPGLRHPVTGVTLGTVAGADKRIAAPVLVFTPRDKIIVSIATTGTASNVDLGARLLYQDGQVAGQKSQVLNTTADDITNIEFTNANPWPAGKYKAEVTVAGAPVQTVDFEVK
jgi:hypothetical protein